MPRACHVRPPAHAGTCARPQAAAYPNRRSVDRALLPQDLLEGAARLRQEGAEVLAVADVLSQAVARDVLLPLGRLDDLLHGLDPPLLGYLRHIRRQDQ